MPLKVLTKMNKGMVMLLERADLTGRSFLAGIEKDLKVGETQSPEVVLVARIWYKPAKGCPARFNAKVGDFYLAQV
ncbi:MAG: hypothetical protein WC378_05020 [Opitutaceae bacterium]|jgi:hypothetical protein